MAEKKFYTIMVGIKEPKKIMQGTLSKASGQPGPDAEEIAIEVGTVLIPNFSRVWARRVRDVPDTKNPNREVAVSDREYNGKVEFLPWGQNGGHEMEIRWLKNSSTLDKAYQEQREKLWWADEQAMIALVRGKNYFSETDERLKVEMLKHHTLNLDNPSRDPSNNDWEFRELTGDEKTTGALAMKIAERTRATGIVMELQSVPGALSELATYYSEHPFHVDWQAPDGFIFEELLAIADTKTKLFMERYNAITRSVSDILVKALELGVIEVDQPGIISYYYKGKKDILLRDLNGEGAGMFAFIIENMFRPMFAEAIKKVNAAQAEFSAQLA